jgi:hypothetical protein
MTSPSLTTLRIPILATACLLLVKSDFSTFREFRDGFHSNAFARRANFVKEENEISRKVMNSTLTNPLSSFVMGLIGEEIDEDEPDEHFSKLGIVDLLEWEEASLQGLLDANVTMRSAVETCLPPPGVSNICCLGTFSNGGSTTAVHRYRCAKPMHHLDQVRKHTFEWFQNNPLDDAAGPQCDICQIVELARQHNLTIALIGDSMHNQIHDGLSCELERRNFLVNRTIIDHNPTRDPTYPYRRHALSEKLTIRSPAWSSSQESVTLHFHRIYLLPLINNAMEALTAEADVVVLGFGLHYWYSNTTHEFKRMTDYINVMSDLFQNVTQQGHVKLMVHRETSAQHFDADGGEFALW